MTTTDWWKLIYLVSIIGIDEKVGTCIQQGEYLLWEDKLGRVRYAHNGGNLHVRNKKRFNIKERWVFRVSRLRPSMYSHLGHTFGVAKVATTFLVTLVTGCMWRCWRFLSTTSNCQLRSKKEETNVFHTHMLLQLTYIHLYWRITILQDTHTNTVEKDNKISFLARRKRWKWEGRPTPPKNLGQPPSGIQPGPTRSRPEQGGGEAGHQGCGAPPLVPPGPTSLWQCMNGP